MQTLRSCDGAGHTLLSGSDDTRLGIWDTDTKKLKKFLRTGHHANIFCTRYMPGTGTAILPVMLLCSNNVVLAAFAMGACTQLVLSQGLVLCLACREDTPCQRDLREEHLPSCKWPEESLMHMCMAAGDAVVATCAGDSEVRVHDVSRSSATDIYRCSTVPVVTPSVAATDALCP